MSVNAPVIAMNLAMQLQMARIWQESYQTRMSIIRTGTLFVNFLQAPDADGVALAGGGGAGGGSRSAHGGDAGDAIHHRAATDRLFILKGGSAAGGVDGADHRLHSRSPTIISRGKWTHFQNHSSTERDLNRNLRNRAEE